MNKRDKQKRAHRFMGSPYTVVCLPFPRPTAHEVVTSHLYAHTEEAALLEGIKRATTYNPQLQREWMVVFACQGHVAPLPRLETRDLRNG